MRILMLLPLLSVAAISGAAQTPSRPAQEVAQALQNKYDAVRDFTADFVQESEGGLLRKKQTERGAVQVKKPGRMRWDYKAPEPRTSSRTGAASTCTCPRTTRSSSAPSPSRTRRRPRSCSWSARAT